MTNDALSGLDDLSGLNNESELPHLYYCGEFLSNISEKDIVFLDPYCISVLLVIHSH